MNARQKLHQAKLNEWTAAFADHKASGLTIRQWCDQNNVSFHAFNYWRHLLKEEVVSQMLPDIVEVPVPALSTSADISHDTNSANCTIRANSASPSASGTPVKLTVGDTVIEITSDIPSGFLCTLLKAVRYV